MVMEMVIGMVIGMEAETTIILETTKPQYILIKYTSEIMISASRNVTEKAHATVTRLIYPPTAASSVAVMNIPV